MKKLIITLLLTSIGFGSNLWSAMAGFSDKQITFQDGSGWKESTSNICGDNIYVLSAMGTTILSNGIILDNTVGAVREFIDNSIIGMIMPFASATLPEGWIPCDGRIIRVSTTSNCEYQLLANRIQTTWGPTSTPGSMISGKFVGRFQLPDLRGQFLRGALNVNNLGATIASSIEGVSGLTASSYQRFRNPAYSGTAVTYSTLSGTLGSYQPSGFTTHSTEHNFTIAAGTTSASNESHGGGTISLEPNWFFYIPNLEHVYDPTDGTGFDINYHGLSSSLTDTTTINPNTHTHTLTTTSATLVNTTVPESYPRNAAVIFGIRY